MLFPAVPPSNVTIVSGNTSLNLSWVPGERERNHGFQIRYLTTGRKRQGERGEGGNEEEDDH